MPILPLDNWHTMAELASGRRVDLITPVKGRAVQLTGDPSEAMLI